MPVEFSLENMGYFIDWTKNQPFQVERGEGECAVYGVPFTATFSAASANSTSTLNAVVTAHQP